ncbi:MAG: hypothetical protein G8345_12880, partial [Magnetococcales bacterium]|nr:hypothetical protein [Magnetococcales bacterium]
MKKAAVLALAILLTPGSVLAATKLGPVEVSANVALVSNYVWRGISQSDRSPAIQGGIDANHDAGFYLGAWGSNVDFDDGDEANIELDIYGGWTKKWDNGFGVDVGIIHYEYPGARSTLQYDFEEYYLGLSYSIMGVNLGAKYSYSPDFFGSLTGRDASYVDLKVDYTLPVGVTLAGHYG